MDPHAWLAFMYGLWPSIPGALILLSLAMLFLLAPVRWLSIRAGRRIAAHRAEYERAAKVGTGGVKGGTARTTALDRRYAVKRGHRTLSWTLHATALTLLYLALYNLNPLTAPPGTALRADLATVGGYEPWYGYGIDLTRSPPPWSGLGLSATVDVMSLAFVVWCAWILPALFVPGHSRSRPRPVGRFAASAVVLAVIPLVLPAGILFCILTYAVVTTFEEMAFAVAGRRSARPGRRRPKRRPERRPEPRPKRRPAPAGPPQDNVTILRTALQRADAADKAGHTTEAKTARIAACKRFLANATRAETRRASGPLQGTIRNVMARQPEAGLDLLELWQRHDPAAGDGGFALSVLSFYVRNGNVAAGWDRVSRMLIPMLPDRADPSYDSAVIPVDDVVGTFREALLRLPHDTLTDRDAAAAGRRLLSWLHGAVRAAAGASADGACEPLCVETLGLLPAGKRRLDRGDVYCALGDLADHDGDAEEATARWRIALAGGSRHARGRLADALAARGHARLIAGDDAAARDLLTEAYGLDPLPAFRVAALAAEVLDGTDARTVLGHLDDAADDGISPVTLAFWRAMAHLRDGRREAAETELLIVADATAPPPADLPGLTARQQEVVRLLAGGAGRQTIASRLGIEPTTVSGHLTRIRQVLNADSDADVVARFAAAQADLPVPADEARILLAALRADETALVDAARAALTSHRSDWPDHVLDPWPMVAAAARRDPDLFVALVESVTEPGRLPEWARLMGAHLLLRRLAERGMGGEVKTSLAHVNELLKAA